MSPPPKKRRVFLSRKFPPGDFDPLHPLCDLRIHRREGPPTEAEYRRALKGAEAAIVIPGDPIGARLMDAAPRLRLLANLGVGVDSIDVEAATARRILVSNTPGVVAGPTAECAMALLLALCRRVSESHDYVRGGGWGEWTPTLLQGVGLAGKTLGILGLGGVGSGIARMASGFEMKVVYWSRRRRSREEEAGLGVRYRPMNRLLAESDFVSVNVALTDETRHLIGEAEFSRMKAGARLINTARGAVVDERAMIRALRSGKLAGAGLDVFEREPLQRSTLFKMKNVVMLPHLGTSTREGRLAMAARAIRNVRAFLAGRRPPDLVNPGAWENQKRRRA